MAWSDKKELFCLRYLIKLNATLAAKEAGYSEKTARSQGQRLLTNVDIQDRIAELKAIRVERCQFSADEVFNRLVGIQDARISDYATFEIPEQAGDKASKHPVLIWKPFSELTEIQIAAIEGIKETRNGTEIRLHSLDWSLEKIAKHIGFYEKNNKQLKTKIKVSVT